MIRPLAGLALGTAMLLAAAACAPQSGPAQSPDLGPATSTTDTAGTASSGSASTGSASTGPGTASAPVETTASPTASGSPGSVPAPDAGPRAETFTTSTGMVSLSVPAGWTVEQVDLDAQSPRPIGVHDQYRITDKDDDITVDLVSHYGEKDNDGGRPGFLGALDTEELTGLGSFHEDSDVYFLAYHLGPHESVDLPYEMLSVHVADVPDTVDPRSEEAFGRAWLQNLTTDPTGYIGGTSLHAGIPLPMVEALTGERGDAAMQAFLETTEYRELKQLMTSYTVHEDAIPESLPGL